MTNMRGAVLSAMVTLLVGLFGSAQAQTCSGITFTDTLQGSAATSAVPFYNPLTQVTSYFGAVLSGSASGDIPGSFTILIAFNPLTSPDPETGIGTGTIISPYSIFALSNTGKKSNLPSGTIDTGTVEYRLNEDGTATITRIIDAQLTITSGRGNPRRALSGCGTLSGALDTATGLFSGTLSLTF